MLDIKEMKPTSKSVLVLGSVSAVGKAIAHEFAREGYSLLLADIETEENERIAKDIQIRYRVYCDTLFFDAGDIDSHPAFLDKVVENLNGLPEGLVICFGYMPVQEEAQKDFKLIKRTIDINFTGAVSILEQVMGKFEERNHGFAIVLSSVAGDRGRKSNYIYGSTKGALTRYLEGLQHRLSSKKVQVLIVKPGFMDTAMTYGLNLPQRLMATPEEAGKIIYKAWKRKRQVVFVKWFWRYIMLIIQHLPRFIFHRTQL